MQNHCRTARELKQSERQNTRVLWEEVFAEDSKAFLDYYYKEVTAQNRIYVEEEQGELISMLHLNPYKVHMGTTEADVYYMVAVATKEAYRHQGCMRRVLKASLTELYSEQVPFVFLMPASERIYQPFDFRTVAMQNMISFGQVPKLSKEKGLYMQKVPGIHAVQKEQKTLQCRPMRKEELPKLAEFSESALARCSVVYTKREISYYDRICREQESMNGGILLFYRGTTLAGYCFHGDEGGVEAWEIVIVPEDKENIEAEVSGEDRVHNDSMSQAYANAEAIQALCEYFRDRLPIRILGTMPGSAIAGIEAREISYRPMTMVRIVNVEAFAGQLRSKEPVEFFIEVKDPFIEENSGIYRFVISQTKGCAERISQCGERDTEYPRILIGELAECFFGLRKCIGIPTEKIQLLRPVYLNEIV